MNNTTTTKKALIYIRVSSEEQIENFSLQTQEEKGKTFNEVFQIKGK